MSTYKDIAELNASVSTGDDAVKQSARHQRLSNIVPQEYVEMLGLDSNVQAPASINGAGTALTAWTTISHACDEGEILQFDRAGQLISLASTDVNDHNINVTGAQSVLMLYIDMTGERNAFPVDMNGQAKVDTGIMAMAVNGLLVVKAAGTSQTSYNLGRIYAGATSDTFTNGKPDNGIWNVIEAEFGLSKSSFYMIPQSQCGLVTEIFITSDAENRADDFQVRLWTHEVDSMGEEISLRAQDYRLIGNATYNGRGIPCLLPLTVITAQFSSTRNLGIDGSFNLGIYFIPLADYPGAKVPGA